MVIIDDLWGHIFMFSFAFAGQDVEEEFSIMPELASIFSS
jgi:hypothetical protein